MKLRRCQPAPKMSGTAAMTAEVTTATSTMWARDFNATTAASRMAAGHTLIQVATVSTTTAARSCMTK